MWVDTSDDECSLSICVKGPHKFISPQSNLHLDILMGRDESVDFADMFLGKKF